MSEGFVSRGFRGRRRQGQDTRLPPGQYLVDGFPVLSAGPTPHTPLKEWDFSTIGEVDEPKRWTREELRAPPSERVNTDIHCVTKWSKLGTTWEGVSVDTLLKGVETAAEHVLAFCDGGYTTNLPLEDVTGGKAWVAYAYEGEPLAPEHGGPARFLVPHLYFWKSAKWARGLRLKSRTNSTSGKGLATITTAILGPRSAPARLRLWPHAPGRSGALRAGKAWARPVTRKNRTFRTDGRIKR